MDVALVSSYDNYSEIACTTGPQPPPSTYYPGEWHSRNHVQCVYVCFRNVVKLDFVVEL